MADYIISGKIFPIGEGSREKYTEMSMFAARCALEHGFCMSFGLVALDYLANRIMPELTETLKSDFCGERPYLLFALHDSPYWDECDRLRPDFPLDGGDAEYDFDRIFSGALDLSNMICELMARDDVDRIELLSMPNHGYRPAYVVNVELSPEDFGSFMRARFDLLSDGLTIVINKH